MPIIKTKFSQVHVDDNNNIQKIVLCKALMRGLSGSTIKWIDETPIGYSGKDMHWHFDIKTPMAILAMLRECSVDDTLTFGKCVLNWYVEVEAVYSKPNRGDVEHIEKFSFNFTGKSYPFPESTKQKLDNFLIAKNMEFLAAPLIEKNKKIFRETRFTMTVI